MCSVVVAVEVFFMRPSSLLHRPLVEVGGGRVVKVVTMMVVEAIEKGVHC